MANKANLEIQFLNLKSTDDIIVKKFFLVNFIDPRLKGNNLSSYLCLIWRYNNLHLNHNPSILIQFSDEMSSPLRDVKYFFGEHFVLRQFWSSFRMLDSFTDFTNTLKDRDCSNPDLASSIIYQCYRNEKLDNSLIFYTVKEKEIYDHIIFPIKDTIEFYNESRKRMMIFPQDLGLDHILSNNKLSELQSTYFPCFALWIGWSEQYEVQSFRSFHYDITYDVQILNNLQKQKPDQYVKISDFYAFFFLPHAYDLDSQACNFPSPSKYVNEDFELEKSYSQKKLEYFDEWEKLGIKSQSAFRTHLSKKFVDYFRDRFTYIQFSFTVEDRDSRLNAGFSLTIATLIITILWELGHDKIDQINSLQQLKYVEPDAFWLIMNSLMFFGAIRAFFHKDWFSKGSSFKGNAIGIGIIAYIIYYALFMLLNIFISQPIQIIWLKNLSEFLFQRYILIHFVAFGLILFLVNKIIFRNIYRRFKIHLFK